MKRKTINPWTWQQKFGYQQGVEATDVQRTLWISGQTSLDADGNVVCANDMAGQINQVIDNIQAVLTAAEMSPANLVSLKFLTTDMDLFAQNAMVLARLNEAGSQHTSTAVQVSRLAYPELMIEIEATAVA